MLPLKDKLVFEVFELFFIKKQQANYTFELDFIKKQLDLRDIQFKNKIIPLKYIKNIFYFDLFNYLKKNNFIIDLNTNKKLLTKLLLLFTCFIFIINPIVAFQVKNKIVIRKFFVFYDIDIHSDKYYIFILKK